jgi:peptidoglycan hydrolase-like protein with peptidoglycan-binding domain
MSRERELHSELAIHDLQRRLILLGYRLDDEAEKGLFGEKTAAAVGTFKESMGLGSDDTLDQTTWTALKDASMQMGDRPLYLHIPHFRGRDVGALQSALSSMGFSCDTDASFGPETEQALRDYQEDMGLEPTGILDTESVRSLLWLRHIWEGKRGYTLEGRMPAKARCIEVLESQSVCVFGIDEPTRIIANRVANLARATTNKSKVVSASALGTEPRQDMLLVRLEVRSKGRSPQSKAAEKTASLLDTTNPSVDLSNRDDLAMRLTEALKTARSKKNRLTIVFDADQSNTAEASVWHQRIAVQILDALCTATTAQL